MPRQLEDVAREAAPFLAELVRKYPPRPARARGGSAAPSVVEERRDLEEAS